MKLKYGPYSPSRLDVSSCGYRFYREYVKKDAPKSHSTAVQDRGSAVHEVLDYMTNKIKINPNYNFQHDEIRRVVSAAVNKHPASQKSIDIILKCAENYVRNPPKTLTEDAETELRLAVKYENGEFKECSYDDEDAFGRGRADIMMISDDTTTALVYDHKTQLNIEPGDTFQMGFYAWVISKIYPFLREVDTILHFSQYGHYSKPIRWMVRMSPEDIENMPEGERENCRSLKLIEEYILTEVEVSESRVDFSPSPSNSCQYCPVIAECPAILNSFDICEDAGNRHATPKKGTGLIKKVVDASTAVEAAKTAHVLDTYLKSLTKEISEYTKKTGQIALPSGIAYGHRASTSPDWDFFNKSGRESVLELFEKHGEDFKEYVGFSSTFSKKLLKSNNTSLVSEVMQILPEKGTTRFGSYKI